MQLLDRLNQFDSAEDQRSAERFGMALRVTVEGEEGATHDLSATGVCFESERRYEVGTPVNLVLEYPAGTHVQPLKCEAEVVRVTSVGDGYNMAVRLITPLFS